MARREEELLVLKAQAGDSRAFEVLYRAYQPSLVKFARKLLSNEAAAHDAVQDAWIMTARKLKDLQEPSMFRARVFKAVRWRVLDQIRKQTAAPVSLDSELIEVKAEALSREGLATQDQLGALIENLPDLERQAVHLFYLEELKVTEIASVLDIPAGTVKSRLNRARARLQESASCIDTPQET